LTGGVVHRGGVGLTGLCGWGLLLQQCTWLHKFCSYDRRRVWADWLQYARRATGPDGCG
jgi:hypothetical protein